MKIFKKLGQVIFPRQKGRKKKDLFVMGARYDKQQVKQTKESEDNTEERVRDVETYFRPSCEAVLNNQLTDFHFFQLTNDTDVLVTQYKKSAQGKWEVIRIDPTKCLKD